MKRLIAILFLLFLCTATYLTGKVYYWKMKQIKKEIKKDLALGNIVFDKIFVFAEDELKEAIWIHSKEFRLNETMYDVFKTDTCGGKIIYHVFQDDKESAWATLFIEHYKYQNTNVPLQAGKDFSPLKFLMKDLIAESNNSATIYYQLTEKQNIVYSFSLLEFYTNNILAPPEAPTLLI